MKKKLLGLLLLITLLFGTTACNDKKKTEKSKIEYTAVYKLGKNTIKTYKMGDTIYYKAESSEINNTGNSELKKNTIKLDYVSEGSTLTFKNGSVLIKSNANLESGTYKKTGKYTNEELFNDFYGDKTYLTSEINGVYEKDDIKIYVYQKNGNVIRIFFDFSGENDLELSKNDDGNYYLEFFEDVFTLSFTDSSMNFDLKTNEDKKQALNGTYTKKSNLGLDEIIKVYNP